MSVTTTKQRYRSPEGKEHDKEYRKAYRQRPEVKARNRARNQKRRAEQDPELTQQQRDRYYANNKESLIERARIKRHTLEGRLKALVNGTKYSVKIRGRAKRNLEHSITYEDLVNLYDRQGGRCALTGRAMTTITKDPNVISVDRINNDIGYTKENIQLVTGQVNRCKNIYTVEEFTELCRAVIANKPL